MENETISPDVKPRKVLHRSHTNQMIGGVCAGLADYFEIDPTIIRIAFVLFTIFGGSGVIIYIILWVVLPEVEDSNESPRERVTTVVNQMKERAHDGLESVQENSSSSNWIAFVLVGLGVYFLLRNLGLTFNLFDIISFRDIIPVALIAGGIYLYYRQR